MNNRPVSRRNLADHRRGGGSSGGDTVFTMGSKKMKSCQRHSSNQMRSQGGSINDANASFKAPQTEPRLPQIFGLSHDAPRSVDPALDSSSAQHLCGPHEQVGSPVQAQMFASGPTCGSADGGVTPMSENQKSPRAAMNDSSTAQAKIVLIDIFKICNLYETAEQFLGGSRSYFGAIANLARCSCTRSVRFSIKGSGPMLAQITLPLGSIKKVPCNKSPSLSASVPGV